MTTPDPNAIITVADAAARIFKSRAWYMNQLKKGELPGILVGRTWILTEADFVAALNLKRREATPIAADPAGLTTGARRRITRGGTR